MNSETLGFWFSFRQIRFARIEIMLGQILNSSSARGIKQNIFQGHWISMNKKSVLFQQIIPTNKVLKQNNIDFLRVFAIFFRASSALPRKSSD